MVKKTNDVFRVMSWTSALAIAATAVLLFSIHDSRLLFAQQPQAAAGTPLYSVNAKYVNGMAPGYWATAGSGLTLDLSAGTAYCGNPPVPVSYPGGTLTLTASATNYIYLDPANNCAPAASTSAFKAGQVPIATVATGASSITSVTDARTWFTPQPCATGATGSLNCSSLGANQNITLTPSGTGATVITNLQDKGGQVFNVRAYGATGNGMTDDSSAINSAVVAAAAVKGTVFIPPGTYLTNSLNTFPSNIAIEAAGGPGQTVLKYTGTGVGFLWSGTGADRVENVDFDCSKGPASACVEFADTSGNSVAYNHFQNVTVSGGNYCLELKSAYASGIPWNTFRNLDLQNCGTHALYMTTSGSGYTNENMFDGGTWTTITRTQQIARVTGSDNLFEDIDASFNSSTGGTGFAFVGATNNTIVGGDLESDAECVTFDANSTSNKVLNTSGFGGYTDSSTTIPSGNDVIVNSWDRFSRVQFVTPAYGSSSGGIDFGDTGNLGDLYLYDNSGVIRLGTSTSGSNDKFTFNMANGAFTAIGDIKSGGHLIQNSSGNFAGTCVFASSSTCTVTFSSSFTSTPLVFLQPVNPGSVTFTLTSSSGAGFTITASASNSTTVNWEAIGNPY